MKSRSKKVAFYFHTNDTGCIKTDSPTVRVTCTVLP